MEPLDVFNGHGIKIELKEADNFLKIKETLTRMGVASKKDNTLYQSVHIFHKRGEYALMHFKEMFLTDGKDSDTVIDENDYARRNTIAKLLEQWGLLDIKVPLSNDSPIAPLNQIKIIPHKDKADWILVQKYSIGTRKKTVDQ